LKRLTKFLPFYLSGVKKKKKKLSSPLLSSPLLSSSAYSLDIEGGGVETLRFKVCFLF
jgi:hypothetical protein